MKVTGSTHFTIQWTVKFRVNLGAELWVNSPWPSYTTQCI